MLHTLPPGIDIDVLGPSPEEVWLRHQLLQTQQCLKSLFFESTDYVLVTMDKLWCLAETTLLIGFKNTQCNNDEDELDYTI